MNNGTDMKMTVHYAEDELKDLIKRQYSSDQPTLNAIEVTFRVTPSYDCRDQPTGGYDIACDIEVEPVPKEFKRPGE